MSNAEHGFAISGAFERSGRQGAHIPQDLRAVCVWSLLGLTASVLAIACGFGGAEIAEILSSVG